jgi:hypothetical protein
MLEKNGDESQYEDSATFNRRFKYTVIAYAIIEFIAIAFVVYYKATR